MKKNLVILLLPFIISCSINLEPEIYTNISPSTFPKTVEDVEAAVTSIYDGIRADGFNTTFQVAAGGVNIWPEAATDIMTCQWGSYWPSLYSMTWTVNTSQVTGTFRRYNLISRGTLTIHRIQDVDMDPILKNRYIAEIKCINAWIAWILYDLYGPIPIAPLEVLLNPQEEVILERPTTEWMVDYISSNLLEAVDHLPSFYESHNWGRVTKGTALMLLLKLYMHEKEWSKAEEIARKIIGLEYYTLIPDYSSIFSKENQRNREIIYAIPLNLKTGNMWHAHVMPYNLPTTNPNITKWSGYRMRWDFYDTFEPTDQRLKTIVAEYVGTDGVVYNRENKSTYLEKGVIPVKYGEDPEQTGENSSIDLILFRYADVLLSLSEAIANKNGLPTQECIELINSVRRRAGLNDLSLSDYTNLPDFNTMILLERGHELFFEGGRRQDMIRNNTYIDFARTIPGNQAADYKKLFPLPQSVINEGKGIIHQNPGY